MRDYSRQLISRTRVKFLAIAVGVCFLHGVATADLMQSGGLNIIVDSGNPSNGLGFLDMSFSKGLSLTAAVTKAQMTYPNARPANASEFDDLFAAVPILYDGSETASSAFSTGAQVTLSSSTNYDVSLRDQLGVTFGSLTIIWTDPDGSTSTTTTRDSLNLGSSTAVAAQSMFSPANSGVGWLLVSEVTSVPEPSAFLCLGLIVVGGLAASKVKSACANHKTQQARVHS